MPQGRPSSVTQEVFRYLNDGIASGIWKPGDKLPSESELSAQLSASRISVRSAIGRLSGLGLVSSHQGKGTFVCQPSEQGALNQLGNLLQPSNADRLSVFEFRKIMESESAALAAIRATSEHVRAMEESIVAMENAESDTLAAQQDMAFHRLIAQSTGNQVIIQVFEVMRDTYTRMFEDNVSLLGKRGVQFHRQILLAIQTRDMSSARQTMLEHLDDTMRAISQK